MRERETIPCVCAPLQFNRRHHCRRCGRVVCARCSPHLSRVEGYDRPQRICKDCHPFLQKTAKFVPTQANRHFDSDISLSLARTHTHAHTHTAAVWMTVGSPQTIRQLWLVSILLSPQHRGGGCYPTTTPITTTSGVRVRVCVVFTANVYKYCTYYNCMA